MSSQKSRPEVVNKSSDFFQFKVLKERSANKQIFAIFFLFFRSGPPSVRITSSLLNSDRQFRGVARGGTGGPPSRNLADQLILSQPSGEAHFFLPVLQAPSPRISDLATATSVRVQERTRDMN